MLRLASAGAAFVLLLALAPGALLTASTAPAARPAPLVGLLLALDSHWRELERLLGLHAAREQAPLATPMLRGNLLGRPVIALRSPMGKIDVAASTAVLITELHAGIIVSLAPAGALDPELPIGAFVLAEAVIEHDAGTWEQAGFRPQRRQALPVDAGLLARARAAAARRGTTVRVGTVATGDAFIASPATAAEIRRRTGALAVDTSAAAVARVAARAGVPVLVVRVITDHAGEGARRSFDETADDEALARATRELLADIIAVLGATNAAPP